MRTLITVALTSTLAAAACVGSPGATAAPTPGGSGNTRAATDRILITINGNLFAIRPDGSGLTRLISGGGIGDADVSSDGTKIAYHKGREGHRDLYLANADGTGPTRLTNTSLDEANPSFSPDGKRLAFGRGYVSRTNPGGLAVMNARPGAPSTIIRKNTIAADESVTWERPDWSPKGDKIAVENWDNYFAGHSYASLALLSPAGAILDRVRVDTIQPEFNRAGTKIAFTHYNYETDKYLGVVTLPSSIRTFPARSSSDPVWSPDGSKIASRCYNARTYANDLCVMNADGSGLRRIKAGSSTSSITPRAWSNF